MSQSNQNKTTVDAESTSVQSNIKKSPSLTSMSSSTSNLNEAAMEINTNRLAISNNTDNKYNISNVLKHIYQIKYFQKSNQVPAPISANTTNTTEETSTSKQFWMPVRKNQDFS